MTEASAVLRDVFGFDDFRPGQKDIVDAVTQGENVLAIMPTGGGKSLCYQLPALLRDGVTIVVSPLIALMRDQVRALRSIGVGAGALTSANTQEENDEIFAGLEDGSLRLWYLAPERLGSAQITSVLRRYRVGMISVDEAHWVVVALFCHDNEKRILTHYHHHQQQQHHAVKSSCQIINESIITK